MDIGVITFYSAQARLLRRRLPTGVECNTVDAFQGREKELVVLS
jgi:superfamily I DNA and/or RNA helicase